MYHSMAEQKSNSDLPHSINVLMSIKKYSTVKVIRMLSYFLSTPHNQLTMTSVTKSSSKDDIITASEEYIDWTDHQLELALKVKETEDQKTVLIFTLLGLLILLWGYIIW